MKKYVLHIGFWVFMLLFIFDYHWFDTSWLEAMGYAIIEVLSYGAIFYANLAIIHTFFDKQRYLTIAVSISIIAIYTFLILTFGFDYYFYEGDFYRNLFSILLNVGLFTGLAWQFFFTERSRTVLQKNLELETTNNRLQIEILKSKINPHFLFNTLNNLNALIVQQDQQVPDFIDKLSNVLRYGLEFGNQKKIKLANEVAYLQEYLELVKLQQPASNNIDFYLEGDIGELCIIPFVLTTLLENAIKYGDFQQHEAGFLHIHLSIEDEFFLEMTNSTTESSKETKGLGLNNIRKQLTLYYGDKYDLAFALSQGVFKVNLRIQLEEMICNEI